VVELNGGDPAAQPLLAATPRTRFPKFPTKNPPEGRARRTAEGGREIHSIEDQVKKVVTGVGALTDKVKDNRLCCCGAPRQARLQSRPKQGNDVA